LPVARHLLVLHHLPALAAASWLVELVLPVQVWRQTNRWPLVQPAPHRVCYTPPARRST
jgi:hypothetical protein